MNVLVIGAHPDDLEFGCGGTLIKLRNRGYKISLLVMTYGEEGSGGKEVRKREQEKNAYLLKAKLYWGNKPDTNVVLNKELIMLIEEMIKRLSPEVIFTHFYNDTHQDHRNVSVATITATRYIRNVLFYEVPTSIEFSPTVFVNMEEEVLKEKLRLLKGHKSQVYATRVHGLSILESAKATALYRGYQNRVKYAEGFVPLRLSLLEKVF